MAQEDLPELGLTPEQIAPAYTDKLVEGLPLGTKLDVTDKLTDVPFLLPDGTRPVFQPIKSKVKKSDRVPSFIEESAIRDAGMAQSIDQDSALDELGRDMGRKLSVDDVFSEVMLNPGFGRDRRVQDIARIEIAKKFGKNIDAKDAPFAFERIKSEHEKKMKAFNVEPREGQRSMKVIGSSKDKLGNIQNYEVERIDYKDEEDIQGRLRRAGAAKDAGSAESVIKGMDLDDELMSVFLDKELDVVNLPLYRTQDGKHAFDVSAAKGKLYNAYYTEAAVRAQKAGAEFTEEFKNRLRKEATARAEAKISNIMHNNLGVYFVDDDPEKRTQEIIDNPWYLGGRLLSPIRATLEGAQAADARYNMIRTSIEDQGLLEYIGALSLGTSIGSAIHAGGWGTPEHIKLIRRGYDITDDYGNVAKIMTPKFLEKESIEAHNKKARDSGYGFMQYPLPSGLFETMNGVPALMGLVLIDPDPTLLLGPIGKGVKAAGKGLKITSGALTAQRLQSARKVLDDLKDLTPEDLAGGGLERVMSKIRKEDNDLFHLIDSNFKAVKGIKPSLDGRKIMADAQKEVDAIQKEIDFLTTSIKKKVASKKRASDDLNIAEQQKKIRDLKVRQAETQAKADENDYWNMFTSSVSDPDGFITVDDLARITTDDAVFEDIAKRARSIKRAGETAKVSRDKIVEQTKLIQDEMNSTFAERLDSLAYKPTKGKRNFIKIRKSKREIQEALQAYERVQKRYMNLPGDPGISLRDQSKILSDVLSARKDSSIMTKLTEVDPDLADDLMKAFGSEQEVARYLKRRNRLVKNAIRKPELETKIMSGDFAGKYLKSQSAYNDSGKGLRKALKAQGRSQREIDAYMDQISKAALEADAQVSRAAALTAKAQAKSKEIPKQFIKLLDETKRSIDAIVPRVEQGALAAGVVNPLRGAIQAYDVSTKPGLFSLRRMKKLEEQGKDAIFKPDVIYKNLEEAYGEDILTRFGDEVALGNTNSPPRFMEIITSDAPMALSEADQLILREGLDELKQRAATLIPSGEYLGRQFLNDATSAFRTGRGTRQFRKKFNEDAKFRSYVFDARSTLRNAFGSVDKWLSGVKTGPASLEYNGRMLDSYQTAIETSGAIKQESALLFKGLRGPKLTKAMENYLGGTKSMDVKGGNFVNTFMNTGTRSLFERAAYHALGGIDNFAEELSKAEKLFDLAQAGDRAEFDKLLAESGKDIDDRFNTTLTALSRAFVPTGLRGKLNTSQSGELSYTAIKLLDDYLKLEKKRPEDIKRFMARLKENTRRIVGDASAGDKGVEFTDKAYGFMKNAIIDGASKSEAAKTLTNVFGKMSDELVEDINKIIDGDLGKIGDEKRAKAAMEKLAEMGLPTLTNEMRTKWGEAGVLSAKLVKLSTNEAGESVWATKALVDKLDSLSGQIIKNLEVMTNKAGAGPTANAALFLRQVMGLFRASITTGVLLPNPRYWINNIFGDFSQMYFEEGFLKASQLSTQNALANLPFVGRPMQNYFLEYSEKLADKNPLLASAFGALVDPRLNKIWNGQVDDIITMPGGQKFTVGELRRNMASDGIMDTFVQETLLEGLRKEYTEQFKTLPPWLSSVMGAGTKRGAKFIEQTNEAIQKHAAFVQQRQRAALYMDKLASGSSRAEAKTAVSNALYDWKNPLSEGETKYLASLFTFYRFQKLASEQLFRNVVRSFIDDAPRGALRSRAAKNMGRIREMEQGLDIAPAAMYNLEGAGEEGQAKTRGQAIDAMYRDVPFWWQGSRSTFYSTPIISQAVRDEYKSRGMNYTYQDVLVPPFTPLDMANQWLGVANWVYGLANPIGSPPTSDAAGELIIEPLTNAMVPGVASAGEMLLKSYGGGTQYVGGGRTYLKPEEADALPLLLRFTDLKRDENNRVYVEGAGRSAILLARTMPFLGTQLGQYWAAIDNPFWAEGASQGMSHMLLKLMGIAPRPKDPVRELSFAVRERKQDAEKAVRGTRGVIRQETFVEEE
jgi:hypothetical protein